MKKPPLPFDITPIGQGNKHAPLAEKRTIALPNKCALFYCRQGEASLSVNGKLHHIHPGDLYIYLASTLLTLAHSSESLEGTLVTADLNHLLPAADKTLSTESILLIRRNPLVPLAPAQRDRFEQLLASLEGLATECDAPCQSLTLARLRTELAKTALVSFCYQTLLLYFNAVEPHDAPLTRQDTIFQNFMLALFRHYRHERTVAFYAQRQNLSLRYFSSAVKQASGFSALHWITNMVVAQARHMLANTKLSTKEIAYTLNFPSPSHFGRYFKLYTGLTPRQYRAAPA